MEQPTTFLREELLTALYRHRHPLPIAQELVADYLMTCLDAFDNAVREHRASTGVATVRPGGKFKYDVTCVLSY